MIKIFLILFILIQIIQANTHRYYPCQPGQGIMNGICNICPNMTSSRGDTCQQCDKGTYTLNEGSEQCITCSQQNYYFNGKDCQKCPNGYRVTMSHECIPCPIGSFHNRELNICEYCPIGTYNNEIGKEKCIQCPEHKVTYSKGSKTCEYCANGTYYLSGKCESCPIGFQCYNSEKIECNIHQLCIQSVVTECGIYADADYKTYKCERNLWFNITIISCVGGILGGFIIISIILIIIAIMYRRKQSIGKQAADNIEITEHDRKQILKMYFN